MIEKENEFHLGLCLAGAISAGAYTAGVLDYLLEALEDWENRRESGQNVPSHRVKISVIGGASAGGMTGMILALALLRRFDPIRTLRQLAGPQAPATSNPFYQAWVDLLGEDSPESPMYMLEQLLGTSDLKPGKVQSALNADFIQKIADKVLKKPDINPIWRSYVQDPLPVFATLSNLAGRQYQFEFNTGTGVKHPYCVQDHGDYACFSFSNAGNKKEGWAPMLPWHEDIAEQYKYSAMATGAFPIGLKPVRVSRNPEMLKKLSWFSHLVKEDFDKPESLTSLIVDGGMINNEPFERVRSELDLITGVFALEKEEQAKENQDYGKFRSTVLMVDPFPSVSSQTHLGSDILGYGANLLSALVNQARIKPVHLEEAMASNCAGQYLISPTRYHYTSEGWQKIEGSKAIACGSLEGFGGFLSKEFRVHDFFLGRANCEKFLRDHFTVPKEKENPIFVKGYEKIQDPDLLQFTSVTDKGLQIIPIFTESRPQPYQPEFKTGNWPKVPQSVLMSYRPQVKNRVDGLIANLVPLSGRDKWLLWAARKAFLSPKLTDAVMKTCEQSLKDHCQLL